jgi:hypothetical protein
MNIVESRGIVFPPKDIFYNAALTIRLDFFFNMFQANNHLLLVHVQLEVGP